MVPKNPLTIRRGYVNIDCVRVCRMTQCVAGAFCECSAPALGDSNGSSM